MIITTNHHWRPFIYGMDVPKAILNEQFDWMEDPHCDGFIHYKGWWSHVSNFLRIGTMPSSPFYSWDGVESDSLFTGTLIRLSENSESYQIAHYSE